MQALILAAGTGSRLGKHTKENTKYMLSVKEFLFVKQIKKYCDWVAHGRDMQKSPPINKVDIDKTYEMVKDVMEAINYDTK